MEASDMTKTPTEASSPIGTSSSSPTSSSSTSPTTTTLSTCLSGHLSSILEKVNEMTNGKQGESKVLKILKGSLEKMRDEFATIEYKVESITDIAIEMLSKVDKKESGTAGEAAVKCPEDCNVKVAAILYEFLDLLAAEVVFGKVARIFTDIGHAFAKMKANCDQDFEQFDKMSKDELVFFNQGHEVKAIGKILEGIENRLLQVEKDEAQSDGLVADGVDPTNTPSPFGGSSSASTTTPSTATTVCPIMDVESDEKVEKLQDAENTAVVLLHRQLMVAEAKVVDLEQQLSLEKRDRMRQDQALQAQMKSLIDEQKIQNEKIRELTGTCDKLDVAALSQSETCRSVSGPLGQHDSMQLIPNEPIELPASSSTIQSLSHDQEESQNADLATMSNDEGGSDEVEITGESQDTNETKESTV